MRWILLAAICSLGIVVPPRADAATSPGITTQPQSQSVLAGSNATLSVVASGTAPLSYQWSLNGTNLTNNTHLAGATNTTLTVSNLVASDAGNYQVVVSNSHGTATSSNATLTVLFPPVILNQPVAQAVLRNSNATFIAQVSGTAPLSYQWQKDGMKLPNGGRVSGATTDTLTLSSVQTNDAGSYQLVATNTYGAATSVAAALTVLAAPLIVVQPSSQVVALSSNVSLAVTASGTSPLSYQWFFNGSAMAEGGRVSGSRSNTLSLVNVQATDSGSYQVMVTNDYGAATSVVAIVGASSRTPGVMRFVNVNSASPAEPYADWSSAATNIQDAVDISSDGDLVVVANGVYAFGGRDVYGSNRVAVTKAVIVQSVNGFASTIITGLTNASVRCVYLTNGAALVGFTLTNGSSGGNSGGVLASGFDSTISDCLIIGNTGSFGGGANGGTLYHCTITGNYANSGGGFAVATLHDCIVSSNSAGSGGGCYSGTAYNSQFLGNQAGNGGGGYNSSFANCLLTGNSASGSFGGGAAYQTTLLNCTVVGNRCTAFNGGVCGGAYSGNSYNCILYNNTSYSQASTPNYYRGYQVNCCTSPQPASGSGNFADDPRLLNPAGGDYRLPANSPCVNAGDNSFTVGDIDLDGNPRVMGLIVDVGAYEFATPTYFTVQPQSQGVNVSQTAVFSALATGPYPVAYQWFFNGTAISGATNLTLTVTNVSAANDGTYTATASNGIVTAASFKAILTVIYPPPGIVSEPSGVTILTGSNAYFSVLATNDLAMTYQWQFDGMNLVDGGGISGSTTPQLNITAALTNNAGAYQVIVANAFGSVTSSVVALTVLVPAAITLQPTDQTVLWTSNLVFATTAIGTAPLNYQWYFNGTPLTDGARVSGSASDRLNIVNAQTNDAGSYQVVVTNNYGSDASVAASLNVFVWQAATLTRQPTNLTVVLTSNAVFSAAATGTTNLSFQWYLDGTALTDGGRVSGSASATLNLANVQTTDAGDYQVVVTNGFGSATSVVASLTVLAPVQITAQPASQAILLNSNATFSVTALGSGLSYQWFFNGTALADGLRIGGSATSTLNINQVQASDAGAYAVIVTNILNGATSLAASLTPQAVLLASVRHVNLNSTNPSSPYLEWSTAATNLQDAIDAAVNGDRVLVTNGVYQTGGRVVYGWLTNRVVINKALTVESVNGPAATVIEGFANNGSGLPTNGDNAVRCVYLTNNASLLGFTLTDGATRKAGDLTKEQSGGAAWCENTNALLANCIIATNTANYYGGGTYSGVLTNCLLTGNKTISAGGGGASSSGVLNFCVISGNIATNGGMGGGARNATLNRCTISGNVGTYGGGVANCTLNNCLLAGNGRTNLTSGGGAYSGTLNNCTLAGNSGGLGAADGCRLINSIIYYNYTGIYSDCYQCQLTNCCTTLGAGNGSLPNNSISNAPAFVDLVNGNYHLQTNSPCINGGNNTSISGTIDLDSNPRLMGGAVDMGAYELQAPGSILPYLWAKKYKISTDGSLDSDGDGLNNWQEWMAGTIPTNAASVLQLASPSNSISGVTLTWQAVSGVTYYLQRGGDLSAQPVFTALQSNIVGQAGWTSYTDTSATNGGPYFYRVGVQ